ncbi:PROTEIN ACCELERATED CELL DEATH 6-LIKE [Salix koriyanagi]|uniref:PROTEIN ACCELERATED CELL DEATH 6-LIKE n=2 Tax=Salix TaxID=40685 RepID=A0A9Q0ZUK3_9ROSI|nr:PROTEIN ACCELERATED CELL DEATH 6-LIKE [Salix koriyanagi]KAJ6747360.1 PROTEIN ACCELERATED CELL DEATH 6-LIKE [Salix koriyanagi]
MAAMEFTDGVNINATIDSARRGTDNNIEIVVVAQTPPTGDGEERKRHLQLYQAALSGDWDTAEGIYKLYEGEVNATITKRGETALHIAAAAEHTHFVKQLVGKMSTEALYFRNNAGNTAFCFAAISGVEALAKVMMDKKSDLAMTRGRGNLLPIYMATLLGHRGMVSYLYDETNEQLTEGDRIALLVALINSDMYDVAWKMIRAHPGLAHARDEHQLTALHALAQKSSMPSNAVDQSLPGLWNKNLNPFSVFKLARMRKLMHKQALDLIQYLWEQVVLLDDATISRQIGEPWPLIFTAAERGNLDFLTILIRLYPDLIFKVDQNTYSIFHIAILNRHEDIFRIIYQIGSIKNLITTYKDKEGNNMLHLAAKLLESPSRLNVIPGAALQLQRELLWFEEVKKVVQPRHIEEKNTLGKTPGALFIEQHKEMMKEGEQWMRDTADSCMLVATLIATVVFAAAFTVPGGTLQDKGTPVFLKEIAFKIFAISDAISLVTSASSLLTFLSIRTSRYAERDFLWTLPNRLIIGLTALFISIGAMMVAFMATFFLVFSSRLQKYSIPIAAVASLPVLFFIWQHFRLFADMIHSTYTSRSLFKPNKSPLFSKKAKVA